jgi:hypothetical protein
MIFFSSIDPVNIAGPSLLSAAIEEKMEMLPVTQYKPQSEKPITSSLQIYPVLVVPQEGGLTVDQNIYLSLYFRDCDRHYSRVEVLSLKAEIFDAEWKARFKITQTQNDGVFVTPDLLITGVTMDMLSEEGKKMLQTTETYFVLEPENSCDSDMLETELRRHPILRLHLDANLIPESGPTMKLKHTFDLEPEKTELRIIEFGSNPIRQTVIIPPVPEGCVHD